MAGKRHLLLSKQPLPEWGRGGQMDSVLTTSQASVRSQLDNDSIDSPS